MIKHLYITEDKVSGLYSDPYTDAFDALHVKASYKAAARSGKISEHAEFTVYEIGEYDDVAGKISLSGRQVYVVASKDLYDDIRFAKSLRVEAAPEVIDNGREDREEAE